MNNIASYIRNTAGSVYIIPGLPYFFNALEPYLSEKTLRIHYTEHHMGYVKKMNENIKNTKYEDMNLEEIIRKSYGKDDTVFNNAAQVWNHNFYWKSMKPGGGRMPGKILLSAIENSFKSFNNFQNQFIEAAVSLFGSGWTWLISNGKKLKIISTQNAETPLTQGLNPLITVDVWEHAYYLDYQNRKNTYLNRWMKNLINWDFAEYNYVL